MLVIRTSRTGAQQGRFHCRYQLPNRLAEFQYRSPCPAALDSRGSGQPISEHLSPMGESLGDEGGMQGMHRRFLGDLASEAAALVEALDDVLDLGGGHRLGRSG